MTPRELERLERDSIYTLRINSDLKDSVIQSQLNELSKVVKANVKKGGIGYFRYEGKMTNYFAHANFSILPKYMVLT